MLRVRTKHGPAALSSEWLIHCASKHLLLARGQSVCEGAYVQVGEEVNSDVRRKAIHWEDVKWVPEWSQTLGSQALEMGR